MYKNILIVEDNAFKRDKIISFLNEEFDLSIDIAMSFTSGWQELSKKIYDVVILDMSLPTYDITGSDKGGNFRTFGGRELARKMKRRKIMSKKIFITQYDSFSHKEINLSIESLSNVLEKELGDEFLGIVYFDSNSSTWKKILTDLLG
ncbi:TPA: response regulator [Photobacterium damselae]